MGFVFMTAVLRSETVKAPNHKKCQFLHNDTWNEMSKIKSSLTSRSFVSLSAPVSVAPAVSSSSTPCWSAFDTSAPWTSTATWRWCARRGTTWCRRRTSTASSTRPCWRPWPAGTLRWPPGVCTRTCRSCPRWRAGSTSPAWSWSLRWAEEAGRDVQQCFWQFSLWLLEMKSRLLITGRIISTISVSKIPAFKNLLSTKVWTSNYMKVSTRILNGPFQNHIQSVILLDYSYWLCSQWWNVTKNIGAVLLF